MKLKNRLLSSDWLSANIYLYIIQAYPSIYWIKTKEPEGPCKFFQLRGAKI